MPDDKNVFLERWRRINSSLWTEWIYRILFSIAFVLTVIVIQEEHFPDACWLMIFVSIWLYFFKLKIVAIIPLIFALLLHYFMFRRSILVDS